MKAEEHPPRPLPPAGAGLTANAAPAARTSRRLLIARGLVLVAVIALTLSLYGLQSRVDPSTLKRLGYPGIFLISLFAYATVILPVPGVAVVFAAGGVSGLTPWGVALAAGLGATLGEISGYLIGFSGQGIVENQHVFQRFTGWMKRFGPAFITVLAAIPSPFFDIVGMVAGILKMPLGTFLFWCAIGQTIKMLLFAYGGSWSIDWLTRLLGN